MNDAAAKQLAQDWQDLLRYRWERFAPELSPALSIQNTMAAGLELHLRGFVPDGEGFAFHTPEGAAPSAAVMTDDALYEVSVSTFDLENMRIGFRAKRFAYGDFSGGSVEVEYVAQPSAGGLGGYMEKWIFRFDGELVEVGTYGTGGDRAFPREVAARVEWPVAVRDE